MDIIKYGSCGKEITLYESGNENSPLIVLNTFAGDGKAVVDGLKGAVSDCFSLLCVSKMDWNRELSPWPAEPAFPKEPPFGGGADAYLDELLLKILPEALGEMSGKPEYMLIAGYSLAGLFALYAMYRTDRFDRVASMSGSLWFPGFTDFVLTHTMMKKAEKVYLSLGDKEDRTRNALLRTVRENTESYAQHLRDQGIEVSWELNPGNHFQDSDARIVRGLANVLKQEEKNE